jgi:hypothetical protein
MQVTIRRHRRRRHPQLGADFGGIDPGDHHAQVPGQRASSALVELRCGDVYGSISDRGLSGRRAALAVR